ncbi:MAG: electron transfer flavoprotein subunit alpha/FixB family protein [Defluviitaleaceae bacterium]|nr:electron transfer flavoprotein subunit alpha/FixB family protein [Defluviitaleaceae bacterium]
MSDANSKNIWIFAEHRDNKLLPIYYELLGKALDLACKVTDREGCRVCALVIGSCVGEVVGEAEASGADRVCFIDNEGLAAYNCDGYATAIESVVREHAPSAFLFGATATGSELAPSVAARLRTGLAAHCVDINSDEEGLLTFVIPAFDGTLQGEILIPRHRPQMATVRPGIFKTHPHMPGNKVSAARLDCPELPRPRVAFLRHVPPRHDDMCAALEDADIVIGCGRGVATDANFANVEKLARKLGAAIAFTRPAVDMGWAKDESRVIGSCGKSVSPKVYLGLGVSGATHHTCGITGSEVIINVNKDEHAGSFGISDYKVVADSASVVNALLKAVEQ